MERCGAVEGYLSRPCYARYLCAINTMKCYPVAAAPYRDITIWSPISATRAAGSRVDVDPFPLSYISLRMTLQLQATKQEELGDEKLVPGLRPALLQLYVRMHLSVEVI